MMNRTPLDRRYDFVMFFDVQDGNPNGDPDAGNLPRVDAETGMGLITDVCLKRKVRNYVHMIKNAEKPYDIYVKEKAVLIRMHEDAYKSIGAEELLKSDDKKRKGGDKVDEARKWMCDNYYDIRTFGAVMSLGVNCGQVRGPIQLTFSRSVDPVVAMEHSITRMAVATEAEAEKQGGDNRTMGRKFTIPYGLYRVHGFVSAHLAAQTGFSKEDLELFWEALQKMFDHDRSAARGLMTMRSLIIFEHGTPLGNANATDLFEKVEHRKIAQGPARKFSDYELLYNGEPVKQAVMTIKV